MLQQLEAAGVHIDAIYYCPHDKGECACRKPEIGLFIKAKADFPMIDFKHSIVVGDFIWDIEVEHRLGCRTILIADTALRMSHCVIRSDYVASSLLEAAVKYIPCDP